MIALGPKSEAALRAAMERLLDGRPERTDGVLTVFTLAREAGVSWATANRAVDLLAEFRAAEARHRRSSPRALKGRIRALEAELRAVRGAALYRTAGARPHACAAYPGADVAGPERDGVIDGLREELARSMDARVVPLRRPPRDGAG